MSEAGEIHRPVFREQGMTYRALVRDVLADANLSDVDADAILWELTPFPLVQGRDDLMPYLLEVRDGTRTFESVYAEMDAAIEAAHTDDGT